MPLVTIDKSRGSVRMEYTFTSKVQAETEKINWWSFSSGSNRRLNTLRIETKKNCKGRSGQERSSECVLKNDRADRTIVLAIEQDLIAKSVSNYLNKSINKHSCT